MAVSGKAILVATDLSARCDRAIDRAAKLAKQWDKTLAVLHVIEKGQENIDAEDGTVIESVYATLPDYAEKVEILIESGSAPKTIARVAEETGATLIVSGVARYNSFGDSILGTAVDYIVRYAKVPVLVVKQRPVKPYSSILVATDFSRCSRFALIRAGEFFPDARLHLVHAYHVPYEAWLKSDGVREEISRETEVELDAFLNDPEISEELRQRVEPEIKYGPMGPVIAKTIRDRKIDLVVLGSHGGGGFKHATIGSNAASLLSWVAPDTLMIREPKKGR